MSLSIKLITPLEIVPVIKLSITLTIILKIEMWLTMWLIIALLVSLHFKENLNVLDFELSNKDKDNLTNLKSLVSFR